MMSWCGCPLHGVCCQGRITKVINMKPDELRSMIEETAGTRMFEQKKQAALKTIEKKQAKVGGRGVELSVSRALSPKEREPQDRRS